MQASIGRGHRRAATAAAVYGLAFKGRRLSSFRLVLVGIAISALMLALTDYMLSRARIEEAQEATRWLLGSLNGRTWDEVGAAADRAAPCCCRCRARRPRAEGARARRRRAPTGSACRSSARGRR